MKKIFLFILISLVTSCKTVPQDGAYANIISNDPVVGRASISCLQKPTHFQPVPIRLDKRDQRTAEVTDANDCIESELRKVALKKNENKKNIDVEIDVNRKKKDQIESIIVSEKSEEFDLKKLEEIIKKKNQIKE